MIEVGHMPPSPNNHISEHVQPREPLHNTASELGALRKLYGELLDWTEIDAALLRSPGEFTVHVLHGGVALCGLPGVPAEWPLGHRWTRVESAEAEANCGGCLACLAKGSVQ